MTRVGVLDHHRVDHRDVGRHRHAIIEKARVLEAPILVVDVLLVQRPAYPLGHPTLDLALDIRGMDLAADRSGGGAGETIMEQLLPL